MAEGTKCVLDTIKHFRCRYLIATARWLDEHRRDISEAETVMQASRNEIERMSQLTTPQDVIAVYDIPENSFSAEAIQGELILALDAVQDPGNMGTIMRVADWFGIRTIICSRTTVDIYNPKVVQATMGAISRVKVHYVDDLATTIASLGMPVYGTFLDGTDMYATQLETAGVIVMGNEGNGISKPVAATVSRKLYIPPYPAGAETSESLNVAMATGIVLAEFRRRSSLHQQ